MKPLPILTKRLLVASGCHVNQLLRAEGCHVSDSIVDPVIEFCLRNRLAIHLLPCPETCHSGLVRPPHGRAWYEANGLRKICAELAVKAADDVANFARLRGVAVIGVVGVERSPACSTRQENPSAYYPSGIFMEELRREFLRVGLGSVPFVSVTGSGTVPQRAKLENLL